MRAIGPAAVASRTVDGMSYQTLETGARLVQRTSKRPGVATQCHALSALVRLANGPRGVTAVLLVGLVSKHGVASSRRCQAMAVRAATMISLRRVPALLLAPRTNARTRKTACGHIGRSGAAALVTAMGVRRPESGALSRCQQRVASLASHWIRRRSSPAIPILVAQANALTLDGAHGENGRLAARAARVA